MLLICEHLIHFQFNKLPDAYTFLEIVILKLTKINKCNLIKLKSFSTAKEMLNKTKIQGTEWKKIFVNEGVPVVAQWLTNPTKNHKVAGSIPGLTQWVNDLALP